MAVILLRMAAENLDITEGNREHCLCDAHEALRILQRIDTLLTEYRPLLAQFRSPAAAMLTARKARKAGR